jgi:hypothetical protein
MLRMAVLLAVLGGCGSQIAAHEPARHASRPGGRAPRYALYTHCGIEWARILGTFWRATRPLSDGNGNPPPGWGNPYQLGTLRFLDSRTAVFSSRVGTVVFVQTPRKNPPFICS